MDHISDFKIRMKGERRGELITFFADNLIDSYLRFKKQPRTPENERKFMEMLCVKISHLSEHDLMAFKGMCVAEVRRGEIFSKVFWGKLKIKGLVEGYAKTVEKPVDSK